MPDHLKRRDRFLHALRMYHVSENSLISAPIDCPTPEPWPSASRVAARTREACSESRCDSILVVPALAQATMPHQHRHHQHCQMIISVFFTINTDTSTVTTIKNNYHHDDDDGKTLMSQTPAFLPSFSTPPGDWTSSAASFARGMGLGHPSESLEFQGFSGWCTLLIHSKASGHDVLRSDA